MLPRPVLLWLALALCGAPTLASSAVATYAANRALYERARPALSLDARARGWCGAHYDDACGDAPPHDRPLRFETEHSLLHKRQVRTLALPSSSCMRSGARRRGGRAARCVWRLK